VTGLTGPGWTVLLGGAGALGTGLVLGYPTLTGVGLAAAVALASAAAATLVRPRVAVERALTPDRTTVGEPALVRLTVRNLGRMPALGFDAVQHLDGTPLRARIPGLAGRQRRVLHVPVATPRRGLILVGPVIVEQRDPLGLLRRTHQLSDPGWLWVRPRAHVLPVIPLGVVLDFEGGSADQAPKGSTAFASLREYQPGDDPRHVHWRSSARLGTLMVREHVDTTEPATTLVLDTRTSVLDPARFEEAVEVAASVAAASVRAGQQVALAALGEDRPAVHRAGGHDVLDRLAAVRRTTGEDTSAVVRLAEQARPGGSLIVVSGEDHGLIARLARLRRRYPRVVVVMVAGSDGAAAAMVTRRTGLAIIRVRSAHEAVPVWSHMLAGRPT